MRFNIKKLQKSSREGLLDAATSDWAYEAYYRLSWWLATAMLLVLALIWCYSRISQGLLSHGLYVATLWVTIPLGTAMFAFIGSGVIHGLIGFACRQIVKVWWWRLTGRWFDYGDVVNEALTDLAAAIDVGAGKTALPEAKAMFALVHELASALGGCGYPDLKYYVAKTRKRQTK